jgi:hypothetical protein
VIPLLCYARKPLAPSGKPLAPSGKPLTDLETALALSLEKSQGPIGKTAVIIIARITGLERLRWLSAFSFQLSALSLALSASSPFSIQFLYQLIRHSIYNSIPGTKSPFFAVFMCPGLLETPFLL